MTALRNDRRTARVWRGEDVAIALHDAASDRSDVAIIALDGEAQNRLTAAEIGNQAVASLAPRFVIRCIERGRADDAIAGIGDIADNPETGDVIVGGERAAGVEAVRAFDDDGVLRDVAAFDGPLRAGDGAESVLRRVGEAGIGVVAVRIDIERGLRRLGGNRRDGGRETDAVVDQRELFRRRHVASDQRRAISAGGGNAGQIAVEMNPHRAGIAVGNLDVELHPNLWNRGRDWDGVGNDRAGDGRGVDARVDRRGVGKSRHALQEARQRPCGDQVGECVAGVPTQRLRAFLGPLDGEGVA